MKLEYLSKTIYEHPEDSLVRIYAFEPSEVLHLVEAFRMLSNHPGGTLHLDQMTFMEPIDGCRLLLRSGKLDKGIVKANNGKNEFECELTEKSWQLAANLAEPFARNESNTFQWLYDLGTPIEFLISHSGDW